MGMWGWMTVNVGAPCHSHGDDDEKLYVPVWGIFHFDHTAVGRPLVLERKISPHQRIGTVCTPAHIARSRAFVVGVLLVSALISTYVFFLGEARRRSFDTQIYWNCTRN